MLRVQPTQENGLNQVSEINSAQIMTVQKDRLLDKIGALSSVEMHDIEERLAYMLNIRS